MIGGLVLAGGASRRMGRDKALLTHQGETLLERATAMLRAAGCDKVLVAGDRPGHECRPDPQPGGGPVQAILGAVEAFAGCDGLAVVAIDMPALRAEDIRALCAGPSAWFDGSPLPAFFRLDDLRAAAARPWPASARELLAACAARKLPPLARTECNLNTPAEWQAWIASAP